VHLVRFGVVGEAWQFYRRHWGVWSLTMLGSLIGVAIGEGICGIVLRLASLGMLGGLLGLDHSGSSLLPIVLRAMVAGCFLGGMMRMAVSQVRGRPPSLAEFLHIGDVWFDLALGSGLLGILLFVGWHLLILPAFIVSGILMFMYPLIVDARLPATGAMIRSYSALKPQWLVATIVHLGFLALTGLGFLALTGPGWLLGGIGLVTGPLYVLSVAVLYRDLFLSSDSAAWKKPHSPFNMD
jgi:hypothetical protein